MKATQQTLIERARLTEDEKKGSSWGIAYGAEIIDADLRTEKQLAKALYAVADLIDASDTGFIVVRAALSGISRHIIQELEVAGLTRPSQ